MPRGVRIHKAGIYHVFNRGVGQRQVFAKNEDRIHFIKNLCRLSSYFNFSIHSYALISNGYNLLIQTQKDNLSLIMKSINGNYARYYNRQYDRKGHLWEGRFKSVYFENHDFLLEIISYIEHLPIEDGVTSSRALYNYSSYRQLIGMDEILPCLKNSYILKQFHSHTQIKDFLEKPVDTKRIYRIQTLLNKLSIQNNTSDENSLPILPEIEISSLKFKKKSERNISIYTFYQKGYTQSYLSKVFGLSQQAISKIITKLCRSYDI